MTKRQIRKLQKEYGFSEMQKLIDSGIVWKMEGQLGREAMDNLRSGACFLGIRHSFDYYGNRIPAIHEVAPGTKGSLGRSIKYYEKIDNE